MIYNWQHNDWRSQIFNVILKLKPNQAFIRKFKYYDTKIDAFDKPEFMLLRRTKYRKFNYKENAYSYIDIEPSIDILENYIENYFGLNSNKTFDSLDDSELNLLTVVNFGKYAKELLIV